MSGQGGRLSFLPEAHTDFVFTVEVEPWSLVLTGVAAALVGLVLWRRRTRRGP